MLPRNRPTYPLTPAITDPVLLRQMADTTPCMGVQCQCGAVIKECHMERHQRSKTHRVSLAWVREQGFIAMAQQAQRVSAPPSENSV